jgi:hypothetical protein
MWCQCGATRMSKRWSTWLRYIISGTAHSNENAAAYLDFLDYQTLNGIPTIKDLIKKYNNRKITLKGVTKYQKDKE